jgi:hypothetical protein
MVLRYGIRGADTYHLLSRALEPFLKAWHWMFVSSFSFAILTFGNDRSGHAEKLFLTSEVTTAFTGSMFKVQGSMPAAVQSSTFRFKAALPFEPFQSFQLTSRHICPAWFQWFQTFQMFKAFNRFAPFKPLWPTAVQCSKFKPLCFLLALTRLLRYRSDGSATCISFVAFAGSKTTRIVAFRALATRRSILREWPS